MDIGRKIKTLRIKLDLTQEELAVAAGTTKQTIHKYETGIISNIPASKIKAIADKLSTTPAYLMGWEEKSADYVAFENVVPIQTYKVPLLGSIACGKPIIANEEFELYVECGATVKADFALKCKGDSMINARIHDGDIVFIREQSAVNNGEIAAVIVGDEATLKRVYYSPESNSLVLHAENPSYEPIVYIGEELENVKILGKAIAFQSDIK